MVFWGRRFPPKKEWKQVDLRYHSSKVEFVRSFVFWKNRLEKNHYDFVWPLVEEMFLSVCKKKILGPSYENTFELMGPPFRNSYHVNRHVHKEINLLWYKENSLLTVISHQSFLLKKLFLSFTCTLYTDSPLLKIIHTSMLCVEMIYLRIVFQKVWDQWFLLSYYWLILCSYLLLSSFYLTFNR